VSLSDGPVGDAEPRDGMSPNGPSAEPRDDLSAGGHDDSSADALHDAEEETLDEAASDVLDSTLAGGLIIRGGALRLGSYVGVVVLSVLATALLTRHLGVVLFGHYTTVISLVSVVSVVTDAGMSSLGTREYAVRVGADREALLRDLLGLRISLTLIGVVLATAFTLAAGYDTALLAGTVVAGLATVALVFQHTLSIPLGAKLRLGAISSLELIRQLLTVVAIVILIALGAGVFPLLAVALLVNLVLVPLTAALVRGEISMRVQLRPRRWLALLTLTVYFTLATAVGTIYVYTAQILTSLVASEHQSGLFAASFRVFIVAAGVPGLLVGGALPMLARAARDDRDRLAYALQRIFEVSLILGVGAAVGMLGGAQFVIAVIAGPKFAASAAGLRILGIAMIASFLTAGWGFALISVKHYRSLLIANAAAFLVSCALTLSLAATNGANGAALATLCGEVTLAVASLIALIRHQPELRPRLAVVPKVAFAAAPAVVLALAFGLPSIVRALLALAVYALLIALTRAVPREILELLPRLRPRRAGDR
jgi:O-antigen/teichoic acid export membrane protein